MFGTAIRRGTPALAGLFGLANSDDSEAGLLYKGLKGARNAVKTFTDKNPGYRQPIIAQIEEGQYMLDKNGNPIPGKHGREFMGKGKGTQYKPIATDPKARASEIDAAYKQLESDLSKVHRDDWRARRRLLNEFMHTQNDYERWSPVVRDTYDGGHTAGDAWKMGMDAKYEEMLERLPKRYQNDLKSYFMDHIVKRSQSPNPHPRFDPNKRQPRMDPLPAAAGAATIAGGANAMDDPEFDEYIQPYPKEGFGEFPVYKDPNAPLPLPTGGDILDSTLRVLDMPMSGLLGLGRGLYGLATGEDAKTALAEGVHVSEQGTDYAADRVEDFVTDKTGDDSLGWMAKWGLLLGSPF